MSETGVTDSVASSMKVALLPSFCCWFQSLYVIAVVPWPEFSTSVYVPAFSGSPGLET